MRAAIARIISIMITAIAALVLLVPVASAAANAPGVFPNDKVYVMSRIDPTLFNVNLAAERLDNNSPLDLVFVSQCPTSNQCISFVNADLSDNPLTTSRARMFALDGRTHHVIIEVDYANMQRAGYTAARRTQTLEHEQGHAVGLNHSDAITNGVERSTSIMRSCGNCGPVVTTPDSLDYQRINYLY